MIPYSNYSKTYIKNKNNYTTTLQASRKFVYTYKINRTSYYLSVQFVPHDVFANNQEVPS